MSKVLLVDINYSSIPIYNSLIKEGHNVYVAGNKNTEFLAKICSNYININYNNTKEIEKIIQIENIEKIVPGCTDISYASCAKIGEKYKELWMGDSYENFLTINNKNQFRLLARELNLPTPKFYQNIESAKKSAQQLIIKPVDSFSGKGINIVHSDDEKFLCEAISYAKSISPSGTFIIEEFVQGQLYSHSAFLANHQIQSSFIVQEDCIINPYAVDSSFVVHNKNLKIRKKISNYIERLSKHLNLADGLIHTQFIKNKNNIWLIEITRRCPGDQYSNLIEYSTGFPYAEQYKNFFLKTIGNIENKPPTKKSKIIRHTISSQDTGIFKSIKFHENYKIKEYISLKKSGDNISNEDGKRIGLLFIDAEKHNKKIYNSLLNRSFYEISIGNNINAKSDTESSLH